MADKILVRSVSRDDVSFAARMTNVQFRAVALRLRRVALVSDLEDLLGRRKFVKARLANSAEIQKWLVNGWSTEQLLRVNRVALADDALRHSLHWAFPQAYYSVFALTLASFKSIGYTEESHSAVIRRFGDDVASSRYPAALCAFASGYPPHATGVTAHKLSHSLFFDESLPETVDAQLAQFLCATRKIDLDDKKHDIKVLTKSGQRRRSFRLEDWEKVSDRLGKTSLLSLLYRKRIKANYRDIDTFLHDDLDVDAIVTDLLSIVGAVNLVHEVFVARAVGIAVLNDALRMLPGTSKSGPRARITLVSRLASL